MAGDRRDELADWLAEKVTPLPPPEGTFQLIKRRARRRKLQRAALTISAAAAVAVTAVLVPRELTLRIKPETGNTAAHSHSTHPRQTSTPTPKASTAQATASPTTPTSSAMVPANFAVSSVTFISTDSAWVIGQAGTPGHCSTQYCTSIAHTSDAGQHWSGVPAPVTGPPDGSSGVSRIRFLNNDIGWAFGPELWETRDGGQTWTQVSTGGHRVIDLETVADRAYAVFANCSGSDPAFDDVCTSFTLERTVAGSGTWAKVGPATTNLGDNGSVSYATLALTDTAGFLLAPDGTLYSGQVAGSTPWRQVNSKAPCGPGLPAGVAPRSPLLAIGSAEDLVQLCPSSGRAYVSADAGSGWKRITATLPGDTLSTSPLQSVAESPSGIIVVGARTGIYVWDPGSSGWQQRATVADGGPSGGFSWIGMTSPTQGVALATDYSGHQIWLTTDGGQTWSPKPVR